MYIDGIVRPCTISCRVKRSYTLPCLQVREENAAKSAQFFNFPLMYLHLAGGIVRPRTISCRVKRSYTLPCLQVREENAAKSAQFFNFPLMYLHLAGVECMQQPHIERYQR